MNRYPSPKSEFQKVKARVGAHNDLIERNDFNWAIETARLEYLRQLHTSATVDPHVSMCYYQRSLGVDDFLKVLYNLAEPPMLPPKMPDPDNLQEPPLKRPRRP